jgi:serine/threonine protein kinase
MAVGWSAPNSTSERTEGVLGVRVEGTVVPDHEMIRPIGRGSFGEVWLARNILGTLRAIKIVWRGQFAEANPYEREFKGIQSFEPVSRSHEGLIDILQVGRNDEEGYFYYVMELADPTGNADGTASTDQYFARTLRSDLTLRGRIPVAESIEIGLSLAGGLSHLHENGLVHRDIKPANVVFVKGKAKLADIGLVSALDEAKTFVGTPGYIPPEGPGTPRADIYSLGKVLYEISTGKDRCEFPSLPTDLRTRADAEGLIELNEVLIRACEPEQSQRYKTAEELLRDLELLRTGQSVKQAYARRRQVKHLKVAAVSLTLAGILTGAAYIPLRHLFAPAPAIKESPIPEANEAFRKGMLAFHQNSGDSMKYAAELFSQAVALDSGFARAYARLALSYFWMGTTDAEMLEKAHALAEKAVALDAECSEAHLALGATTAGYNRDYAAAEKHDRLAISLNPTSDENYYNYAAFLAIMGRNKEALIQAQKAQKLDYGSFLSLQSSAFIYEAVRDHEQVIRLIEELIQREPSSKARLTTRFLIPAYREKGDYSKAIALEEEAALLKGEDAEIARERATTLRKAYEEAGKMGYWKRALAISGNHDATPVQGAILNARAGNTEEAFRLLEIALGRTPAQLRFEIYRNPAFDDLRQTQRFQTIVKRLGMELK